MDSKHTEMFIEPLLLFGLVWLDLVLWYINHCGLFNAKSSLYI